MRIVGCGFNSDIACRVAGIADCPANDTHRKTHVSTDELFTQSKALPICIRREEPWHVKDILRKETY